MLYIVSYYYIFIIKLGIFMYIYICMKNNIFEANFLFKLHFFSYFYS